jgi:hypothetical protein
MINMGMGQQKIGGGGAAKAFTELTYPGSGIDDNGFPALGRDLNAGCISAVFKVLSTAYGS